MSESKNIGDVEMVKGIPEERVYTLSYTHNGQVCTKHFKHVGDLRSAIVRGREHVSRMKYKSFMFVAPFIVDLDHQERLFIEKGDRQVE